jgi:hypothetical protein
VASPVRVSSSAAFAVLVGFVVLLSPFLKPMMAEDRFAGLAAQVAPGGLGLFIRAAALEGFDESSVRLPALLTFGVELGALLMAALFRHASS